MLGFTFNKRHSAEFNACWRSTGRPLVPDLKGAYESLPGRDGSYDFSAISGRPHYEDRAISGELTVSGKDMPELQKKLSAVAAWLMHGWSKLIFDDMPDTVWHAKLEKLEPPTYSFGKSGTLGIYFRASPFSSTRWRTADITLGDDISVCSAAPLKISADYAFNISGSEQISINNRGTWYTAPLLTVTGEFSKLILTNNGSTVTYSGDISQGESLVIDFDMQTAFKDGLPANNSLYGICWELKPGDNAISVNVAGNARLQFDMDFKNIYGGGADAESI